MSEDVAYLKEISRLMSPFLRLNREGLYRFGETENSADRTAQLKFECLGGGIYQGTDPDNMVWYAYAWQVTYLHNEGQWFESRAPEELPPAISINYQQGDVVAMAQWLNGLYVGWRADYPLWSDPEERTVIAKTVTGGEGITDQRLDGPTLRMIEHLASFSTLWELELRNYRLHHRRRQLRDLLYWLNGIRHQYRQAILNSIQTSSSLIA